MVAIDGAVSSKSMASGRMGKATEYLVAASCILMSRGHLNVSTALVDDEGVDLVFHARDGVATLAVQVKARMSDTSGVQKGVFRAQIRSQTFRPRSDLDLLFVSVDVTEGRIDQAWLVPSMEFDQQKGTLTTKGHFRFVASLKPGSKDQWSPYRCPGRELPGLILERVGKLQESGG